MSLFFRIKRRLLWKLFSHLPKKQDKVVLQSYYGRGYSDSPKAIADVLLKDGTYRLYWVVKGEAEAKSLPEGIIPVKIDTARSIFHLCTAGFWIDNSRKYAFTEKRGKQYYIQTWHGFPLKRIEKDAGEEALGEEYIRLAKKDSEMADLFTSDSKFLSDIYRNGFWYSGEILETGLPRNDFTKNPPEGITDNVRRCFSLDGDTGIILYAPTFRKGFGLSVYDLDYAAVCEAAKKRFGGKWVILAKLHPNIASKASELNFDGINVINASDYPDINELYISANLMITDYSSTMFDYMITEKPCFLYVNDVDSYKNDRNFYFDLSRLPYDRAETSSRLTALIEEFDENGLKDRISTFFGDFGINESGHAARDVVDKMNSVRERNGKNK